MHTGTDVTSDEIMEMYCEPCKRDGTSNLLAEGFCVKCEDFICGTCVVYHKRYIPDHIIKSRQEMSFDFDTGKCNEHDEEPIKFYCERCDNFACSVCKQSCHSNCGLIKHLYEFAEAFEVEEGNEIVSKISTLKSKASDVQQNIAENVKLARKLRETVKTNIKKRKKELIAEFDQIENEVDTIESTDQDRLQNCAKAVDKLDDKLTVFQKEIDSKEHKSKYRLFMGCKRVAKSIGMLNSELEMIQKEISTTKYNYTASKIGAGMLQNHTEKNLVQRTAMLVKTKLAGLMTIFLELLVGLFGLVVIFSLPLQRTTMLIKTKLAGLLTIFLQLLVGLHGLGVKFSLPVQRTTLLMLAGLLTIFLQLLVGLYRLVVKFFLYVLRTMMLIKTMLAGLLTIFLQLLVGLYGVVAKFLLHVRMHLHTFLKNYTPLQKIKDMTSHCRRYVCSVAKNRKTIGLMLVIVVVGILVWFVFERTIYEYVCIIAEKIVLFIGLHGEIIGWLTIRVSIVVVVILVFFFRLKTIYKHLCVISGKIVLFIGYGKFFSYFAIAIVVVGILDWFVFERAIHEYAYITEDKTVLLTGIPEKASSWYTRLATSLIISLFCLFIYIL